MDSCVSHVIEERTERGRKEEHDKKKQRIRKEERVED
jgi:hypothetical protein